MSEQVLLQVDWASGGRLVSLPGRLTEAGFRDRLNAYQWAHAAAGRARRCLCCNEHLPARRFEGPATVCSPCEDDIYSTMQVEEQDGGATHPGADAAWPPVEGHDEAAPGGDWCPKGCQLLHGLGECGMCGYVGNGVSADAVTHEHAEAEAPGRYRLAPRGEGP